MGVGVRARRRTTGSCADGARYVRGKTRPIQITVADPRAHLLAVAHGEGVPAVLETMNPSNVELYRREGWEVVGHTDGRLLPTTWVLVNPA